MNLIKSLTYSIFFSIALPVWSAPDVRDEIESYPAASSVLYHVYEGDKAPVLTPAPKGYSPIYVSHYGRHGSRWLTSAGEYRVSLKPFEEAIKRGSITSKGREVYEKVKRAFEDGRGREGSLSPLGARQHEGIARRMVRNFPEIFEGIPQIDARATMSVRCVTSMTNFCSSLQHQSPKAQFTFEASNRTTDLLNVHNTANARFPEYAKFNKNKDGYLKRVDDIIENKAHASDFAKSLLGPDIFKSNAEECKFMLYLFWLACDQQNVLADNSLWNAFTPDQLYWLAVADNFRCYVKRGSHASSVKWNMALAAPLLEDIVERCDSALASGKHAADLRFGHDSTIMALAPLMQLDSTFLDSDSPEEVMETWNLRYLTPMAANIQIILYAPKNKKGEILAKILYNEKETKLPLNPVTGPYYRWSDLRQHFKNRIKKYN